MRFRPSSPGTTRTDNSSGSYGQVANKLEISNDTRDVGGYGELGIRALARYFQDSIAAGNSHCLRPRSHRPLAGLLHREFEVEPFAFAEDDDGDFVPG